MNARRRAGELGHVLCVEDDPHLRALLELSLQTVGGMRVTLCESGEEAPPLVRAERPDMILLDVELPGRLDGPGTLAVLRADDDVSSIPVVFVTGRDDDGELRRLRSLGAHAVIRKPFDPLALAATLQSIWKRSR